jgi:hypothetical protein
MSKTYKEINECPELYDNYDEYIENEGYLYDDLIIEQFDIEEEENEYR